MESMATFREKAGVLVSSIVVLSLVALVFFQPVFESTFGVKIVYDQTLLVTLTGMADIALGYLIGKQSSQPSQAQTDSSVRESIDRLESKP